ncbi:MAG: iron-containing alcohol dehydrogenase family protein [Lentisphaeraceae bacterium]|nr:iron-containing alcohol dehydrogenase family protein [Lentisphaeraceae bacterium]
MLQNKKNVSQYLIGSGAISYLPDLLKERMVSQNNFTVFFIDCFFKNSSSLKVPVGVDDLLFFVDTSNEPTTTDIDSYKEIILQQKNTLPNCIVGIGGGATMDTAKAVANLLTNEGKAEEYQGWDLLKNKSVYTIGIPTISGTGSEASRTCVLTNKAKGLKMGMNSDFTLFNQLILDPDLTNTVPRDQYFYTGMDTYLHCIESLNGSLRNSMVDSLSEMAVKMCREVFLSDDMMSDENREKMMIASYLGGSAAGNTGLVHPLSAGLSIALDTHHCISNCLIMNVMDEFYPAEFEEFQKMKETQNVELPTNLCKHLPENKKMTLYNSSIIHEKPLTNHLGKNYRKILTKEKVLSIFDRI